MFWGIHEFVRFLYGLEEETWVQLWAGVFGAVPAAVISAVVAAGVAMFVLGRSNAHQQVLAAEAVAEQRRLAELQLREQRTEALRAREQAAIAEVIIAAETFLEVTTFSSEELAQEVRSLKLAVARWRAELGMGGMQHELLSWPPILRRLGYARTAALEGAEGVDKAIERETLQLLVDGVAAVTSSGLEWQRSDERARDRIQRDLTRDRERILQSLDNLPKSLHSL